MLSVDTSRPPSSQSTSSREPNFYVVATSSTHSIQSNAIGHGEDSSSGSKKVVRKGHRRTESDLNGVIFSYKGGGRGKDYTSDSGRAPPGLRKPVPQYHKPLFLSRPSPSVVDGSDKESFVSTAPSLKIPKHPAHEEPRHSSAEAKRTKKTSLYQRSLTKESQPTRKQESDSSQDSDLNKTSDVDLLPTHDSSSATSGSASGLLPSENSGGVIARPMTIRSSLWAISRKSVEGLFSVDDAPRLLFQGVVENAESPLALQATDLDQESERRPCPPAPLFLPTMLPDRESIYLTPSTALAAQALASNRLSTMDWPEYSRPPAVPGQQVAVAAESPAPSWTIPPAADDDVVLYSPPPRTPTPSRPSMPSTPRIGPTTSMPRPRRSSSAGLTAAERDAALAGRSLDLFRSLGLVGTTPATSSVSLPGTTVPPLPTPASRPADPLPLDTKGLTSVMKLPSTPAETTATTAKPAKPPTMATTTSDTHRPYQADYSRWTPKRATTFPLPARSPSVTMLQATPPSIAPISGEKDSKAFGRTPSPQPPASNADHGETSASTMRPSLETKVDTLIFPATVVKTTLHPPGETIARQPKRSLTGSVRPDDLLSARLADWVQEVKPKPRPEERPGHPSTEESPLADRANDNKGDERDGDGKLPSLMPGLFRDTLTQDKAFHGVKDSEENFHVLSGSTEPLSENPVLSIQDVERRLRGPTMTSERLTDSPALAALRTSPVRQSPATQVQSSSATPLLYAMSIDLQPAPPIPALPAIVTSFTFIHQQPDPSKESPVSATKTVAIEPIRRDSNDGPVVRPPTKMPLSLRSPSRENLKTKPFPITSPDPPPEAYPSARLASPPRDIPPVSRPQAPPSPELPKALNALRHQPPPTEQDVTEPPRGRSKPAPKEISPAASRPTLGTRVPSHEVPQVNQNVSSDSLAAQPLFPKSPASRSTAPAKTHRKAARSSPTPTPPVAAPSTLHPPPSFLKQLSAKDSDSDIGGSESPYPSVRGLSRASPEPSGLKPPKLKSSANRMPIPSTLRDVETSSPSARPALLKKPSPKDNDSDFNHLTNPSLGRLLAAAGGAQQRPDFGSPKLSSAGDTLAVPPRTLAKPPVIKDGKLSSRINATLPPMVPSKVTEAVVNAAPPPHLAVPRAIFEQDPRLKEGRTPPTSSRPIPSAVPHSSLRTVARDSPTPPAKPSPIPPVLPTRPTHHRTGSAQSPQPPLDEDDVPLHQLQNLTVPVVAPIKRVPSPNSGTRHKAELPPPKTEKLSKPSSSARPPTSSKHHHKKGHAQGDSISSTLRSQSPGQGDLNDSVAIAKITAALQDDAGPPPPPKKTPLFSFWKTSGKTSGSSSSGRSESPTPAHLTKSRTKAPTPTPPRASPTPEPPRNVDVAPRHAASKHTGATLRKAEPAPEKKDRGILKMWGKRPPRAISSASTEAVLGASNNNAGPSSGHANGNLSQSPQWEDKELAVKRWRNNEPAAQAKRSRRYAPGVVFELPPGAESQPGSPTAY